MKMRKTILLTTAIIFFLVAVSSAHAALTVSVSLPSKSLTENEQVTATITVSNTAGSSQESNVVTTLSSGTSWFSVVTDCTSISTLSGGSSGTSTCIIKPTSTGSDLTLSATSESQGGNTGSGSTSGINVAAQSSSLTASVSADSSVATSTTFYAGITVTAPSANDVANARTTISESGACTVDTSYLAATQSLGNITKGTSKTGTNWKLTSSSSDGTCSITVNVVSDVGGSASPSKSITVGTGSSGSSGSSSTSSTGGSTGGGSGSGTSTADSTAKVTLGKNDVSITIPSIAAKSTSTVAVSSPTVPITSIQIKTVNVVSNLQITAEKLDAMPGQVVDAAPGAVNQYLKITVPNLSASDIEKVTIDFKVEKSWITANAVGADTVALYRYEKTDQWNKLATTKGKEDATHIFYQAVSPGFSFFAIAGTKTGEKPAGGQPTGEAPAAEIPQVIAEIFKKDNSRTIIIAVVAIAAVGGAVYYFVKIKPKKK